tara:strand:+ start:15424 stop:15882 length:459 start_codon:yes stop_codon:yes gene_type:complete
MTVLEVSEKLYGWYAENDVFLAEKDFKKIIPLSEDIDVDKACLEAALEELEKHEMIVKKEHGDKEFWILKRPYSSFEQTITLHAPLAQAIAEEINSFCDIIKDDTDRCDPTSIRDTDIGNLVMLYKSVKPTPEADKDNMESWFNLGPDEKKD